MWIKYHVAIQIRDRIMGGIPKDPEIIKGWLQARGLEELAEQTVEEMGEQLVTGAWNGFKADEDGLYIEGRQVKAMFKEAANVMRHVIGFKGPMRARLAERLVIKPDRIHLGAKEPSGYLERPIHVMTRMGPRDALKRTDYVEKPKLLFDVWLLDDGMITDEHLRQLLEYAGETGLGADRSQDEGKFDLVEFELKVC